MQEPSEKPHITLKTLREGIELSQEGLAQKLHISWRTVSDWERGNKTPRFDNAIALARELGVSLKTLARAMNLDVSGVPDDDYKP